MNSDSVEELINKYEPEVFQNIDMNNVDKIIEYLDSENVDYIDELLRDYLDLFLIDLDEFKIRFNKLKQTYGENVVDMIAEDLSILDNF